MDVNKFSLVEAIIWECASLSVNLKEPNARKLLIGKCSYLEHVLLKGARKVWNSIPQEKRKDISNIETTSNTVSFLLYIRYYVEKIYAEFLSEEEKNEYIHTIKWLLLILHTAVKFGFFLRLWPEEERWEIGNIESEAALRILHDLEHIYYREKITSIDEAEEPFQRLMEQWLPHHAEILAFLTSQTSKLIDIKDNNTVIREEDLSLWDNLLMAFVLSSTLYLNIQRTEGKWTMKPAHNPHGWLLGKLFRHIGVIKDIIREIRKHLPTDISSPYGQRLIRATETLFAQIEKYPTYGLYISSPSNYWEEWMSMMIASTDTTTGAEKTSYLPQYMAFTVPELRGWGVISILIENIETFTDLWKKKNTENKPNRHIFLEIYRDHISHAIMKYLKSLKHPEKSILYTVAYQSLGFADTYTEGRYDISTLNKETNLKLWSKLYEDRWNECLRDNKLHQIFPDTKGSFLWQRHMIENTLATFKRNGFSQYFISDMFLDARMMIYYLWHLLETQEVDSSE